MEDYTYKKNYLKNSNFVYITLCGLTSENFCDQSSMYVAFLVFLLPIN